MIFPCVFAVHFVHCVKVSYWNSFVAHCINCYCMGCTAADQPNESTNLSKSKKEEHLTMTAALESEEEDNAAVNHAVILEFKPVVPGESI